YFSTYYYHIYYFYFFLLFPRQLRSTLFPYTTLFRSTGVEQLTHDERVNWFPHVSPNGKWIVYVSYPAGTVKHPPDKDVILRRMRDRKSTRLNSSHVAISYAVFCLKKKKI